MLDAVQHALLPQESAAKRAAVDELTHGVLNCLSSFVNLSDIQVQTICKH